MVNHAAVGGNRLWHRPIGAAESSHATAAKAEFPITPCMGDDDANHHAFGGLAACIILGRVSAECIGPRWSLASEPRIDRPFTMTPWQRISLRSRQARTLTARRAALRQAKHRNNQPLPAIRTCLGRFQC